MDDPFPAGMVECIEWFLRDVHPKLTPGLDICEEAFATDLFFPLQRQAELRAMMKIARVVDPVTVMEIGADKGAGVYQWLQCLPTVKKIIACEIRGCPYNYALQGAFKNVDMYWLPCSSQQAGIKGMVNDWLNAKGAAWIDVLFIDGDKGSYLKDFDAYLPMMNPSGIVFMHDIHEPRSAMRAAFEAVKARGYRTQEIIDVSDSMAALKREAEGVPPTNPHEAWLRHWRGFSCGVGVIWLDEGKSV